MLLNKCSKCNKYTLDSVCPVCKSKTSSAHPMRFSLEKEKKYGKYRRASKANV